MRELGRDQRYRRRREEEKKTMRRGRESKYSKGRKRRKVGELDIRGEYMTRKRKKLRNKIKSRKVGVRVRWVRVCVCMWI